MHRGQRPLLHDKFSIAVGDRSCTTSHPSGPSIAVGDRSYMTSSASRSETAPTPEFQHRGRRPLLHQNFSIAVGDRSYMTSHPSGPRCTLLWERSLTAMAARKTPRPEIYRLTRTTASARWCKSGSTFSIAVRDRSCTTSHPSGPSIAVGDRSYKGMHSVGAISDRDHHAP